MKPSVWPMSRGKLGQHRSALGPAAFADQPVLTTSRPIGGEDQHHGVVGDLLDERVRDIGDRDAARRGGGDIDRIDADACRAR